jgi:hypothetical protein
VFGGVFVCASCLAAWRWRWGRLLCWRSAGDAVELLHVLADLFGDRVWIDQLVAGRDAEEGCGLIAALQ